MLTATWFFSLLVAIAVAAPVTWAALEILRFRRRRLSLVVMGTGRAMLLRGWAVVTTALLVVLAAAVGFNRQYQYIPSFAALAGNVSPDLVTGPLPTQRAVRPVGASRVGVSRVGAGVAPNFAKSRGHGVVFQVEIGGPASGVAPRRSFVYLPPQYFDRTGPRRRFPVLYLLHGSPGVAIDWLRGGHVDVAMDELLAHRVIQPFIVVLPDANGGLGRDTECQDIPHGPHVQTYLTVDVVHYVDTHFRTVANRLGRVIGGLSSGGYCALNLAFRHQDVFSGAVSHSGYLSPELNSYTGRLFATTASLLANSPSSYLSTIPIRDPFGVYLDVGAADHASRAQSVLAYRVLRSRDVPVVLRVNAKQGHDFAAWSKNLSYSLPWVSSWFDTTHANLAPLA